jgi:hypothetical protein
LKDVRLGRKVRLGSKVGLGENQTGKEVRKEVRKEFRQAKKARLEGSKQGVIRVIRVIIGVSY